MPPEPIQHELTHYTDAGGTDLFGQWLQTLSDPTTRAAIAARLIRLRLGLFGDCKPLGDGLWEQRTHYGPGFRVFYTVEAGRVILLLAGSDKGEQAATIKTARKRLTDWKTRKTQ